MYMSRDEQIEYEREMEAYYSYRRFSTRELYGDEYADEMALSEGCAVSDGYAGAKVESLIYGFKIV